MFIYSFWKKKSSKIKAKKKKNTLNLSQLLLHQAQLLLQIRVHAREAQQQNAASGNVETRKQHA
jgi:hypothetical protein